MPNYFSIGILEIISNTNTQYNLFYIIHVIWNDWLKKKNYQISKFIFVTSN